MAYNDFTLERLIDQFSLEIEEHPDRFADIGTAAVSALLSQQLEDQIPLAITLSTEKARSELLISPVLLEVRRQMDKKISLFSGVEFNVDDSAGLKGVCDFLLSVSPQQMLVTAPAVCVVEAKNESLKSGIGQCIAEMIAVARFNKSQREELPSVYGVITIGTQWRFLEYSGNTMYVDTTEYSIQRVEKVVGILLHMLRSAAEASAAVKAAAVQERRARYSVL